MEKLKFAKAICYSGYRAGQSPKTVAPSKEEIREDLHILDKEGYKYLRMYDPNIHAERVLEIIHEEGLDMKCMIGIDSDYEINNPMHEQNSSDEELKKNAARNDAELDKLIALVKKYPDEVLAVSVGNENTPEWGAHLVSEERLIEHAKKLKANLDKPVTFCEGFYEWPNLKELPKYLDFISVHSYPLHGGKTFAEGLPTNKEHYAETCKLFPDKQVIFTEMGWTSSPAGHMVQTEANLENLIKYNDDLRKWLDDEEIIGFVFEAFDEPWKGPRPDSSECNWGLYYVDRTKKVLK